MSDKEALKLQPDEIDFWKAIVLATVEGNLRKWFPFYEDPEAIADACVLALRRRCR